MQAKIPIYPVPQRTAEHSPAIGLFGTLCATILLVRWFLNHGRRTRSAVEQFWRNNPVAGSGNTLFQWTRSTLSSVFSSKELVDEGYKKYSRAKQFFTMPSFDRGGFVVVPPVHLKKLYGLPESKLDSFSSQLTAIQAQYTIEDLDILQNPFHAKILGNQLPKNLDRLTGAMAEELDLGFNKYWSSSEEEWASVTAWSSSVNIVARSMNRVFVGAPICQNDEYIDALHRHGRYVFSSGFLINVLPAALRPLVGALVKMYGRHLRRACLKPLLPLIDQRSRDFDRGQNQNDRGGEPPQDAIQWAIEDSRQMDPKYHDTYQIGHRILLLNFASIHSTGLAVANTLQDLFSSDPALGIVEDLREECIRVFHDSNGRWTREAVSKLVLLDSAIRESMRVSSLSILGLPRRIKDPEGITTSDGTHLPSQLSIITPVEAIHLDPSIFPKPKEYHAFRFCTAAQVQGKRNQVTQASLQEGSVSDPSSSHDYKFIPFGFGRHACPGRFFALHQAKLLLAYVLMNYEVEHLVKRPEQLRFLWVQTPLDSTTIRVRKRADAIWQKGV